MNQNKEKVIEIENLTVHYQRVCALSNIDLTVSEKEFLGIIGPNGGGKSTLLKTILGLVKPDSGNIKIFNLSPYKARGLLGYVPQFTKFNRDFPITVKEAIMMGRLSGRTPVFHGYTIKDREVTNRIMDEMELYPLRNRQIGQLSGGQLQRVLIARALTMEPGILLLDEPTANLDTESKSDIYSILEKLNQNITIIMVTHDMGAISSHVRSLACLNTQLYYHGESQINEDIINQLYGCPIDLVAHGTIPHRVLKEH